jgi:hypothetical protein
MGENTPMTDALPIGTRVIFRANALGTVHPDDPYHFTPHTVGDGDFGEVIDVAGLPDEWIAVRPDNHISLYVPIHPNAVEPVA